MENTLAQPITVAGAAQDLTLEDFDAVVRQHQQRIYRVLMVLLRDPDAAATLTQECFLKAYSKRDSFRGEASLSTWLTSIAINTARDYRRSKRVGFWRRLFTQPESETFDEVAAQMPSREASPEQSLLAREQLGAVWRVVEQLPGQQREVFLLRFVQEMSLEEIAAVLDVQIGTAKSHLFRALKAVRERTEEHYRGNTSDRR